MNDLHKSRVGILASGEGTTAEAFIEAAHKGLVDAEVGIVICNRQINDPQAGIYERIKNLNKRYGLDIDMAHVSEETHPAGKTLNGQTEQESSYIAERFLILGIGHVILMGYSKNVKGELHDAYGWKSDMLVPYMAQMTNTHPGPLPETIGSYGIHAARTVLHMRLPETKHSVNLVGHKNEAGPIIAEHPVPIIVGDTAKELCERTKAVERIALPYAIDKFLRDQKHYFKLAPTR